MYTKVRKEFNMQHYSYYTYLTQEEYDQASLSELIAYRMKNLRIDNSLSQEQLAFEAGLDRSYVGQIERCEKNVTVVTLDKIAQSLGIDLKEFLTFDSLIDPVKKIEVEELMIKNKDKKVTK